MTVILLAIINVCNVIIILMILVVILCNEMTMTMCGIINGSINVLMTLLFLLKWY